MLIEVDDGRDPIDVGGIIHLAIADEEGVESRRSRIYEGRDWVRLRAVELGLTRKIRTVTISLPPQLAEELDRVREREHRTRSEILRA